MRNDASPPPFEPAALPHHWVNRLGFALRKELTTRFQAAGLSATAEDWGTLLILSQGAQTPSQLSDASLRDRTTVTRLVDRLVRKGWVERQPDAEDRRRLLLSLTGEGQAAMAEMRAIVGPLMAETGKGISAQEQQIAVSVMQRMLANLQGPTAH